MGKNKQILSAKCKISRKIKALTTILLKFEIYNIEDLLLRFSSKYLKSKRPNIKIL